VESHGKLYCRGYLSAELVVVDCEAESVIRHIQLPSRPGDLAYNSTHDRLYVSCPGSNCVLVIDCGADTVVAEVRAYETPVALLYSAPDDRLYVTTARGLFVLDCGPDTALARLEPDCSCLRLAYNPLHNKVYAIGPAVAGLSDIVAVIDGDDERVVAQIPLPRHADKALYNPVSDRLYITTYRDGVWVIDGATDRLIAHAGLDDPWALALNCRDNRIYVGDGWSSTITVLQDGEPSILSNPAVSSPAFVVRLGATIGTRGARLHDVSGRVVRELLPGASSLTGIMPGVYFLRERGGVERKLVVVR
jgi:DNA-binding beta-propeller fold protein YncE